MTRRRMSVADLAAEAGVDVDEALLRLCDDGLAAATSRAYLFPKRDTEGPPLDFGVAAMKAGCRPVAINLALLSCSDRRQLQTGPFSLRSDCPYRGTSSVHHR